MFILKIRILNLVQNLRKPEALRINSYVKSENDKYSKLIILGCSISQFTKSMNFAFMDFDWTAKSENVKVKFVETLSLGKETTLYLAQTQASINKEPLYLASNNFSRSMDRWKLCCNLVAHHCNISSVK